LTLSKHLCGRYVLVLPTFLCIFSPFLPTQKPNEDLLTRCLDTLFVLARTTLNPIDPRTFVPAHDHLTRATSLLGIPLPDTANYTRCVSGAFHNLGATMYQAGRHGTAIGFLKEACMLGAKAWGMWKREPSGDEKGDGRREKAEDGWRQLEEQLYRRWELLGVCYSKIGDRKVGVFFFFCLEVLWLMVLVQL
jgi:separase